MRKLTQALLISLGCFAVSGAYADEAEVVAPEVAIDSEQAESEAAPSLFNQEEEVVTNGDCNCGKPKTN